MSKKKCSFPEGIEIRPDGVNPLDPCVYETLEVHKNVTVEICRCKKCGHIEVSWYRQEDTEDVEVEGVGDDDHPTAQE